MQHTDRVTIARFGLGRNRDENTASFPNLQTDQLYQRLSVRTGGTQNHRGMPYLFQWTLGYDRTAKHPDLLVHSWKSKVVPSDV